MSNAEGKLSAESLARMVARVDEVRAKRGWTIGSACRSVGLQEEVYKREKRLAREREEQANFGQGAVILDLMEFMARQKEEA